MIAAKSPGHYAYGLSRTTKMKEQATGEKLKLGKQKAEIQRPALSIPSFHISAFCFLLSQLKLKAWVV